MVPPGAHLFYGMKISSVHHLPPSTAAKLRPLSSLSSSMPLSSENWIYSSQLASIFSDHTYVAKSHRGGNEDYVNGNNGSTEPATGVDDDEALSSRALGLHNATESADTDFLQGLDDLNFGLDLDTGDDVEMDSLQDFIDSALDGSTCSFLNDKFTCDLTQQPHQQPHQGVEDICKEEFLSSLCLRSTQLQPSNSDLPLSSFERAPASSWAVLAVNQDTLLLDMVPTKRCVCMVSETVPKAVYSMAQPSQQNKLSTSRSTLVTNSNDSACTNCSQTRLMSERAMSPLFIDTSFSECSQSLMSSSGHSVNTSVNVHQPADFDHETADVINWLAESQQTDNYFTESLHGKCENEVLVLADASTSSLDLESFVDLDDYLDEDLPQQITSGCSCDHSPLSLASQDAPRMSPLTFSLLDGHQDCKPCSSFEFKPHFGLCRNISDSSHTPEPSNTSPWSSPAWSVADSSHLSPVSSMDLSGSTASDNNFEDPSLKGQLAILMLFSEDNAESLLLAESSVPTIRFV